MEKTPQYWRARARNELTIVIPAFGCAQYLTAAVESALHGPAASVLIADDASGPAVLDVASELERSHPGRVRVLNTTVTRGTATNLNEAINEVETPYFAKLDGDDVLIPGYLETVFPIMASRPGLALIAGHELRIEADEAIEFRPELLPSVRSGVPPRIMTGAEAYRFILNWNPNPCSCGTIYRAEAFREVGGYDRDIKWGEDWEIWLRFAQDWEVGYSNLNSALYRIHPQSATAAGIRQNRLCYGYDAVFRRAAEICKDPELIPLIRRAFFLVAKGYFGAAGREARRSRKDSLTCCRQALRALSTAVAL
jgi:glycosyltransferase involved in cell wall biosynthesis